MKTIPVILCFLVLSICPIWGDGYADYVNPFIGTGAVHNSLSGNCYPGATVPFGMIQLSPDTRDVPNWDCAPGYDYNDKFIYGFSHTRLSGTGVSDLIDLMLMPTTQEGTDQPVSPFSHEQEEAYPGYYRVKLLDSDIDVQLSATTRTGIHRYIYPVSARRRVYLDLDHSAKKGDWGRRVIQSQLRLVNPTTLEGFRIITGWAKLRKVYFHIQFSHPIIAHHWIADNRRDTTSAVVHGENIKAFLDFGHDAELMVKVALSPVSIENARLNMQAEATSWQFDDYTSQAEDRWNEMLGRIEADGTDEQKTLFYTALYHTLVQPNTMSDVNGEYRAPDYTIHRMPKGETYYSTFSLWDTYRAAHPLYNLVYPDYNQQFIHSMMRHYNVYGYLPIWQLWGQENYCMIGNHSIPVIADAILNGGMEGQEDALLDAMVTSMTTNHVNAPFDIWEKYEYIPEDLQSQSVSITLETCFNDWCVAQVAKKLGREDIYKRFSRRAAFYRHLFNPSTGFFQAKDSRGQWLEDFDPLQYGANGGNPFTEGNAWQYLWYVPHNMTDLVNLIGGKKAFSEKLDMFFSLDTQSGEKNSNASGFIGQYIHGNEPDHHVPYLYNFVGKPWKTQNMVHQIKSCFYTTESNGYAGNDDCGEMSAWFIFSSMGFYPVCPASGRFELGSPLLRSAKIHLPNGRVFRMDAARQGANDIYVRDVSLGGSKLKAHHITYQDIVSGRPLQFRMSSVACR